LIVAHRGASALAPENTLAAFEQAVADGAEGIEFDVRLAKDGVAVVHHDATLKRTGGNEARIESLTSDELGSVPVSMGFNQSHRENWKAEYATETVPTLASVLERLRDYHGRLYVELKADEGEDIGRLVRAVCDVIRDVPNPGSITVKSFRLGFIPHLRALCPGIRTAALFAPKIMTVLRKEKYLVDLAAEFGADEISVHYSLATKKLMKKAGKLGLPITIWTVDHPRWLKRAIKLGVNAVITNDPAPLIAKRREILG